MCNLRSPLQVFYLNYGHSVPNAVVLLNVWCRSRPQFKTLIHKTVQIT